MTLARGTSNDRYLTLTGREREVLQLVSEGHTNQEIADLLQLSIKTIQTHRASVMEKLELRDVTHLVRYAVRRGLVDPER
jgi:DNA-binding CsgD family transcriptional regulator